MNIIGIKSAKIVNPGNSGSTGLFEGVLDCCVGVGFDG
jgi:hypothetical protein